MATMTTTGSLNTARAEHRSILLPNGKVLAMGGNTPTCELYDPSTGLWTSTGSLNTSRTDHTATLLTNGKVLVTGGSNSSGELYNPSTGIWTTIANAMFSSRTLHSATLLNNGKVLIVGNTNGCNYFNPVTSLFESAPTISNTMQISYQTANLLNDGTVLLAGGNNGGPTTNKCTIFTGTSWVATGLLNTARYGHSSILLSSGKVLVIGGRSNTGAYLTSCELYDPIAQTWSFANSLNIARQFFGAVSLPSGLIFVAGGQASGSLPNPGYTNSCELFNGSNWATTNNLSVARAELTTTLLPSNSVLIIGGRTRGPTTLYKVSELYQDAPPPTTISLFDSVRTGEWFSSTLGHAGIWTNPIQSSDRLSH